VTSQTENHSSTKLFSKKVGLNCILIICAIALLTASFIWDRNALTTWYSLWTVASSVVLGVMILFLLYELVLWTTTKAVPPTIESTLTTILIVLFGDVILLQTDNFFWKWQSKLTMITAIAIALLLTFYFIVKKYFPKKEIKD
jgi:hypothetical protein